MTHSDDAVPPTHGFFSASGPPPTDLRFRIDPGDGPADVLRGILRGAAPWAAGGAVMLALAGVCQVLVPVAVEGAIDTVITPALVGASRDYVVWEFVRSAALILALYVTMMRHATLRRPRGVVRHAAHPARTKPAAARLHPG